MKIVQLVKNARAWYRGRQAEKGRQRREELGDYYISQGFNPDTVYQAYRLDSQGKAR